MTSAHALPRTRNGIRGRRDSRPARPETGRAGIHLTTRPARTPSGGYWPPRATCRVAWSMRRVPFGGGGHVALPITPGSEFDSFRRAAGGAAEGHPTQFPAS